LHNEAPADIQKKFEDYFQTKERTSLFYLAPEDQIVSVLPGATFNTEFRVTSDAYFEIVKLLGFGFKHGDPTTPVLFKFKLTEYASGRSLMTDYVRGEDGWGSAQYPFIPYESYLLERDYRIKLELINVDIALTGDFYLTMIGRRIPFPAQVV
jgi:hypothetical protein